MRTKRIETAPTETNPDWAQGYGFQVWLSRHGYRGDGAFGQFCLILPGQDAVLALTAATEAMQEVLDAVWEHLLPAFDRGAGESDGDAALAARLRSLALPPLTGSPAPADAAGWRCRVLPQGDVVFDAVELSEDAGGWLLALEASGDRLVVPVGREGWQVVESGGGPAPVAVSGGWVDPEVLRVDLLFLETPHRLRLTVQQGGFLADWRPAPLGRIDDTSVLGLGAQPPLR
jgi:hypothetical protein